MGEFTRQEQERSRTRDSYGESHENDEIDKWQRVMDRRRDRSRSRIRKRSSTRREGDRQVRFSDKKVAFIGDSSLKILMKEADVQGTIEKYGWEKNVRVYRGLRAEEISELTDKDQWETMDAVIISMGINNMLDVNKDYDETKPRKDKINEEISTVMSVIQDFREWASSKKVDLVVMGPNYTDRLDAKEIEKLDNDMRKTSQNPRKNPRRIPWKHQSKDLSS